MDSVGIALAIVATITVIVLLYMWPEIFGRIKTNEYFANPSPPATNTLPIDSMNPTNLIQAVAIPNIKSVEGFANMTAQQAPAMPIADFKDGNGDTTASWNGGVGNGYGSNRAAETLGFSMGPLAGTGAGSGPLILGRPAGVYADTTATAPRPIPAPVPTAPAEPKVVTTGKVVMKTGQIPVGDVNVTPSATEGTTSTPDFTVSASLLDQNAINMLKTNLASMGDYTMTVTSNLPGVTYSFPLLMVNDITNLSNKTVAIQFTNPSFVKESPVFFGAKTLGFQVVQTAALPKNAPNATEGFESSSDSVCGTFGKPSADNGIRVYTQIECEKNMDGNWFSNGECLIKGGGSYSAQCAFLNTAPPSSEAVCGTFGKPSADNGIRVYTKDECEKNMNGEWIPNGECLVKGGGSYSAQCAFLNNKPNPAVPTPAASAPPSVPKPAVQMITASPIVSKSQFNTAECKNLGYPSIDNKKRLYSKADCGTLTGIWKPNGDCVYSKGGLWNDLCSSLNPVAPPPLPPNALLQTPMLQIGDVGIGPYIKELDTPYPAFIVNATVVDPAAIEQLKTDLASSGQYTAVITSDVPGLTYKFPIIQVSESMNPASSQTFAYTFMNAILKKKMVFKKAKLLSIMIVKTAMLPNTAPNAQLLTQPIPHQTIPTPPNAIMSQPPATEHTILASAAKVSPLSYHQYTSQSGLLDAHTLAQKIRDTEIMIKGVPKNVATKAPLPVATMPPARKLVLTEDSLKAIMTEQIAYLKSQGYDITNPKSPKPSEAQMQSLMNGSITNLVKKGLVPAGTTMDQIQAAQMEQIQASQKQIMESASINAIKESVASGQGSVCPINDSDIVNGIVLPSSPNYNIIKKSAAAGCKIVNSNGKPILVR
jgi:hypothetical protein